MPPAVAVAPHFSIFESRDELDSFDPIIVMILPDDTRAIAESRLFPTKMFEAIGVSPSVYLHAP